MSEKAHATILNVNDNPATLLATGRALRRAGYEVLEAPDGTTALQLVRSLPDLVLLDVQLPDVSGFEVCRRIKADPTTALIPVLHMSAARVDASSKITGLEGGADGYLTAPVELPVLLAYVRALLRMHQAEAEVVLSARQWEATFSSIEDGVCVLDDTGRVLRHNPAMATLMRIDSDQIRGAQALDLARKIVGDVPENIVECLTHLQRCAGVELYFDGRWIWLTLFPVSGNEGVGSGAVLTLADISERKRMEEQSLEARKMSAIQRLTAGMAHDFNNLLTSINGFAELIAVEAEDDERVTVMAETILRSGERAAGLVRQLMAFSQKQRIVPQAVNLNLVLGQMRVTLNELVGEGNRVVLVPCDQPVTAMVDPEQMEQVITNLVAHARDTMPVGGTVTVETGMVTLAEQDIKDFPEMAPGQYALLRVQDTGPGLSQDVRERIFEPFLFISDAVAAGTGLRLAAAYGIVKQSKGHIRVDNVHGEGTSFSVLLPYQPSPDR